MNKEQNNIFLMRQFHLRLEKGMDSMLEEFNLNFGELHILILLNFYYNGEAAYKKIEKLLNMPQSSLLSVIQKMENKGFVISKVDERDKRVKILCITEKGEKFCNETHASADDGISRLFSNFSEEEKEIFFLLLNKICGNSEL